MQNDLIEKADDPASKKEKKNKKRQTATKIHMKKDLQDIIRDLDN